MVDSETNNETNPGVGTEIGICECCNHEKYLTKHHIVPYAFSRNFQPHTFPDNFMLLCRECHDIVEIELRKFRKFFCGRLGITQDDLRQSDEHIRYKKAKAYAWQLVSNHGNIPTQKIMEMTMYVHNLCNDAETYEDFYRISRDESKITETRSDPYGKIVAIKIKELGMEEWFYGVWLRKNKAVVRKLQAKGVKGEIRRKKRRRHYAPESSVDTVIAMLMHNEKMTSGQANTFYKDQDGDTKLSLRRCAYAWERRKMKAAGITNEASKEMSCTYLSDRNSISIETATEMYRMSSKSKKKSIRQQAHIYHKRNTTNGNS